MATTVDNVTLTVTVKEAIDINGQSRNGSIERVIEAIDEYYTRIHTVTTGSELTIATFGAEPGFVVADVQYIRISNLDDSIPSTLSFLGASSTDFSIRLDPGCSWIAMPDIATGLQSYGSISGGALQHMTSITAECASGSTDLEVIIASK
jgi:hypothetical protein